MKDLCEGGKIIMPLIIKRRSNIRKERIRFYERTNL